MIFSLFPEMNGLNKFYFFVERICDIKTSFVLPYFLLGLWYLEQQNIPEMSIRGEPNILIYKTFRYLNNSSFSPFLSINVIIIIMSDIFIPHKCFTDMIYSNKRNIKRNTNLIDIFGYGYMIFKEDIH